MHPSTTSFPQSFPQSHYLDIYLHVFFYAHEKTLPAFVVACSYSNCDQLVLYHANVVGSFTYFMLFSLSKQKTDGHGDSSASVA